MVDLAPNGHLDPVEVTALARTLTDRIVALQVERDRAGVVLSTQDQQVWVEDALQAELESLARTRTAAGEPMLSVSVERSLAAEVRRRLNPVDRLLELLADPLVENVTANGPHAVWITRADGTKRPGPSLADSDIELIDMVRRLASQAGRSERRFDSAHPFLDLQLPDGSRLHAIMEVTGTCALSLRKHRHRHVTLADLAASGTMAPDLQGFLAALVRRPSPANVVIAGGTDAGKTTLLRALISEIDRTERLITIEDSLELMLEGSDVLAMETRPANVEGAGAIGMRELVRQSLRMRPDRVIVGEVRGPEVVDMLNAMSTGNDGSLCTIHADSARSAINRIITYGWQADLPRDATAAALADSVHVIVHLRKLADGTRAITQVLELTGLTTDDGGVQTLELWEPGPDGRAQRTLVQPSERLRRRLGAQP